MCKREESTNHKLLHAAQARILWQLNFFSFWSGLGYAFLSKRKSQVGSFFYREEANEILEGGSFVFVLGIMEEKNRSFEHTKQLDQMIKSCFMCMFFLFD